MTPIPDSTREYDAPTAPKRLRLSAEAEGSLALRQAQLTEGAQHQPVVNNCLII